MCLSSLYLKCIEPPLDKIVGYKPVRVVSGRGICSWNVYYWWKFGEPHKAERAKESPSITRSKYYRTGIHAYCTRDIARDCCPKYSTNRSKTAIMKVLLFGVTHHDNRAYRADWAIPIGLLDRHGHRIPWPGK